MNGQTTSRSEQINELLNYLPNCSPKMQAQILRRLEQKKTQRVSVSRQAGEQKRSWGQEHPWGEWLEKHFPFVCTSPFGTRHVKLWEWFEALAPGTRPRPRVEIWPRGGAKSTTVELGCARLCVKLSRRFVLYVSETQDQANKHVQAISSLMEALGVGRAVNAFGNSRGWKVDLLRTENGFNVAAIGLDAAARGVKLDNYRPDLIVFDDIDGRHDTPETIEKKTDTITTSLLPTGSSDCAVLFVQNKIHKDSIFAQLTDGRADFLHDREVPTEEPAVVGLEFERREREDGTTFYAITGGEPTWEGQNLAVCEQQLNAWGRKAFQREAQHRVDEEEDGLWQRERDIEPFRVTSHPTLTRVVVGLDPSATSGGDEAGIVVAGISYERPKLGGGWERTQTPHAYVLEDRSLQGSPRQWASEGVTAYNVWRAAELVAEQNNGGEMVEVTISTIQGAPEVKLIHASRGKLTRAEPVQKLYEDGRVHHVGVFKEMESEMCSWQPGDPSPNRMDALVWTLTELLLNDTGPIVVSRAYRVKR